METDLVCDLSCVLQRRWARFSGPFYVSQKRRQFDFASQRKGDHLSSLSLESCIDCLLLQSKVTQQDIYSTIYVYDGEADRYEADKIN